MENSIDLVACTPSRCQAKDYTACVPTESQLEVKDFIAHNQRLVAIYTWQTLLTLCLKANSLTLYPEAEGHTQEAHFRPRCYTESRVHVVHEFWLAPVNRVRACHCLVFGGDE